VSIEVKPDWWKTLFDEIYLLTDARSVCDDELTKREVDLICELLPIKQSDRILDLCGGQGRHSLEMAQRGFTGCTVLDYSHYLVDRGTELAAERGSKVAFVQGDARDTGLAGESFDNILLMGNSLGYLPTREDDLRIVSEAYRLLKPGSGILVDTADGEKVSEAMSPVAWHEVDSTVVVCRRREIEGDAVKARELVLCKERGVLRDQTYSIRMFSTTVLVNLLEKAGFSDVRAHNGFSPHEREGDYGFMNRRIVAVGVK
jgi:D-alanine-D-alanine ligase